ncbi:alpha/beta fold hydrolase [Aquipuribacter sp. MA13-6]|uniref:alpha/beta fold hydrolase n=1 Tax=unclassified Aquipuribacter TaxID=2635084 RepID=UPI003EEF2281
MTDAEVTGTQEQARTGRSTGAAPHERFVEVASRRGPDTPATVLALRVHRSTGPTADGPASTSSGSAVLVHGLASNARMWDACAAELARAGVTSVAVDLRGHGRSADRATGPHGTSTAAADVADVVSALLGDGTLSGPVVLVGQSWGGNVVLTAAAAGAAVDALALVDGGWLRFDQDEPFEQLWTRLAPPTWDGTTWDQLVDRLGPLLAAWGPHALPAVLGNLTTDDDGTVRNVLPRAAHEQILRSMYDADPREAYPLVPVPVLLAPAGSGPASALVHEAATGLPRARVSRYDDSHHDLHLQHPARLAADLLDLLSTARAPLPAPDDVEHR